MKILKLPIATLHPDPANARRHSERNLDSVMSSLMRFGQQKPIVIDEKNIVRAGNCTFAAAKALGWKEIDCVCSTLVAADLAAYAIADNRTAELAEWDADLLHAALDGMDEAGLKSLAFDNAEELAKILDRPIAEELDDVSAPLVDQFEVVVECRDEQHQREVYERLIAAGETCRVLTM
ncbi:MAG: ParB N-terminal domain-containing protein [Phycisphaerae bacterium]|nr:ParB N-terminal domain-containing protein [Phycisphaerae bacterium]